MRNISDITVWKQNLGLLPIHLKPATNELVFVMLNGGYGDFCLQTANVPEETDYFSASWSSNTKNYVLLDEDKVTIYNWSRNKSEEVTRRLVAENFDKFYTYLLSKSYKSEKDIVPFVIDIFRQFRNITLEKTNPVEALNLLFVLLTSLDEDYNHFDNEKWNVDEVNIPDGFDFFIEKLRAGIDNIKPELDLIIRHSAGILFQEAQKEVLFFNPQRDLFGGVSSIIETKTNLYSSIHYTPPYLARTIVENSIRRLDLTKARLKIFDPACGSSEFLVEALKQLKELNFAGNIEIIAWDSSETAIHTSKFLLKYEQRTIWHDRLEFTVRLVNDSLTEAWDDGYDLILMNPPFVSWELLNKNLRSSVKETLGTRFTGKPNQASAFFFKAVQHLTEAGVIGCVVPSSLLTLDAYKKLREDVQDIISISLIGKLGNFVFEDALADVSLIVGYIPKTNQIPTLLWTRNEKGITQNALRDLRKSYYSNEVSTVNEKDYSIFQPLTFPIISDSWKSISFKENELLKKMTRLTLEKRLVKVKDIFAVKQGINSGNNRLFKLKKSDYLELPVEEQRFFRPTVDNDAIKQGTLSDVNYVWYPYDEDGIQIKTEEEFRINAPVFFNKLSPYKQELSARARKDETNWWYLSEHRVWLLRKEPRLVSTRFGNSDSFAFDKKGDFIVENGNAWLPKKEFNETNYYFYLAVFSSPFFNNLLSIYSRQLSGGNWFDLGMKYSQEIPIPNITLPEINELSIYWKLVEVGKELAAGNSYIKLVSDEILQKYFYPEV
jgi:type I restriction-modification system DNA methylase subunit